MGSTNTKAASDSQLAKVRRTGSPSPPEAQQQLAQREATEAERHRTTSARVHGQEVDASDALAARCIADESGKPNNGSEMEDLITFQVMMTNGMEIEAAVPSLASVIDLRNVVAPHVQLPAGANLRLLQGPQVLNDKLPISALDPSEFIFAVVCRDTPLEQLLLEAGTYEGYAGILSKAFGDKDANNVTTCPMPSILDVLEDMGGQLPKIDGVTGGAEGAIQFANENGVLILPSLDLRPYLSTAGVDKAKNVTLCVGINSDAYNRGLGVVVNANPSLDVTMNESGLPNYAYNGYGLQKDIRGNAIKFHPGMSGGQLRIEGKGGHGNRNIGFTPKNWTVSRNKLHLFEITLNTDGSNHMRVTGTRNQQVYSTHWKHQLFDGRYAPSMYAWLDLGSSCGRTPLHVGPISIRVTLA